MYIKSNIMHINISYVHGMYMYKYIYICASKFGLRRKRILWRSNTALAHNCVICLTSFMLSEVEAKHNSSVINRPQPRLV